MVKASASGAEDPGFESRLMQSRGFDPPLRRFFLGGWGGGGGGRGDLSLGVNMVSDSVPPILFRMRV